MAEAGDERVVDLTARIAEQAERRGDAARRGVESVARAMEQEAAQLPAASQVRALLVASALVLRHGVDSDDPSELEWMVKASGWLVSGMNAEAQAHDDY